MPLVQAQTTVLLVIVLMFFQHKQYRVKEFVSCAKAHVKHASIAQQHAVPVILDLLFRDGNALVLSILLLTWS